MPGQADQSDWLEAVNDEAVLGFTVLVGIIGICISVLCISNRGRSLVGTIHPDNQEHVASIRQRLLQGENHQGQATNTQRTRGVHIMNDGDVECPICLEPAVFAVETNCGHVFCGHCMITYWQYQTWLGAVRCPSCRTEVSVLMTNFSSEEHAANNEQKSEIVHRINQYNRGFSAEPRTFQEYLQDMPTLLAHACQEFFSIGGLVWLFRLRIAIVALAAFLYFIYPLDILPEAVFGIVGFLDDMFVMLSLAMYVSIMYRQVLAARGLAWD